MLLGWGCYQRFLIALSSVYISCSGFASTTIPVILPIARCDLFLSYDDAQRFFPVMNVLGKYLFQKILLCNNCKGVEFEPYLIKWFNIDDKISLEIFLRW